MAESGIVSHTGHSSICVNREEEHGELESRPVWTTVGGPVLEEQKRGHRDGSVTKRTYCSCGRPGSGSR